MQTVKLIATFVAIFVASAILLLLGNILGQNLLG
jgi:hypothetical protein